MKIIQKNTKKIYILIGVLVIILTAGLSYYVFALNGSLFGWQFRKEQHSSINMESPTDEQIRAGERAKADTIEKDQGKPGTGDDTSTPPSQELAVSFSAINQNDGKLQVRVIIDELLASGTCTLTLTNTSQTVTKTAAVYPSASTSTCQGFDIPVSELSATTWSIAVKVTSDNKSGIATTSFHVN